MTISRTFGRYISRTRGDASRARHVSKTPRSWDGISVRSLQSVSLVCAGREGVRGPHFYACTFETSACNIEFVAETDVDVRDICFRGSLFGPGGQSLDELFCSDEETSHRRLDITHLELLVQRRVWRCTLTLRDDV